MRNYTLTTDKRKAQARTPSSEARENNWEFCDGPAPGDDAKYVAGVSLVHMVKEDLATHRIAVECCRNIIQYLRDQDPETRHMLESVLKVQGERAGETANYFKL